MNVTLVQYDVAWLDKAANMKIAGDMIAGCGVTDLIVLPEMFATGFCMDARKIAEPENGGELLAWMKRMAYEKNAAIAGSMAVDVGKGCCNRLCFVTPDGVVEHYDKRHLFSYSEENLHYLCGKQRKIVEFRGVRILLQICYDLRFPVWSRNCGDYDLALYVASWPVNRIAVWDLLLKARAVENQCYVVGANRVGADPVCDYTGNSAIIHPYGKAMAELRDGESGCVSAELDMEWLSGFRDKFPSLRDADKFHIEV